MGKLYAGDRKIFYHKRQERERHVRCRCGREINTGKLCTACQRLVSFGGLILFRPPSTTKKG